MRRRSTGGSALRNGAGQSTTASSENSRPRSCHQHDFHGRWSRRAARVPRLKIAVADAPDSAIFPTGWSRRAAGVTTGKEDRTRPHLFPAAGHAHEALHWGQRRRVPAIICDKCGLTRLYTGGNGGASRRSFATNVDLLHILLGRPWWPPAKCSVCRVERRV